MCSVSDGDECQEKKEPGRGAETEVNCPFRGLLEAAEALFEERSKGNGDGSLCTQKWKLLQGTSSECKGPEAEECWASRWVGGECKEAPMCLKWGE